MVTIECPFCDEPVRMDGGADAIRCDGCSVEVDIAPDEMSPMVAQAA